MRVSSSTLSRWYAQLATCLDAGLTLERAVATIPGPPQEAREILRDHLQAGETLEHSLNQGSPWVPGVDRQLIVAGSEAGRLPEILRRLSARHEASAAAGRRALMATLYPLFVAHFAVFALPLRLLISGPGLAAYLLAVIKILIPFWVVMIAIAIAVRKRFRPLTYVLDLLPLIAGYRRFRAVADLAFVLEAQVLAGIRFDIAWLQAALASGDRRLEPIALAVAEAVQQGRLVSETIAGRSELPSPFAEFWSNGESTGTLDNSLNHLSKHFGDLAARKLGLASIIYPKLLFAIIAIWIAMQILDFYGGYFRQFEELL